MDLECSLEIIIDAYKEYIDSRVYFRYCIDNALLQFGGDSMSYIDYKKELGFINVNNKKIDKNKIRIEAKEILSNIFG